MKFKEFPYAPLMYAIYPLLFLICSGQVSFFEHGIKILFIIISVVLIFWFIVKAVLKSNLKSNLILILMIISFYQGGEQFLPFYLVLLIFLVVFCLSIFLSVKIIKTQKDLTKYNKIANLIAIVLFVFSLSSLIPNEINFYKFKVKMNKIYRFQDTKLVTNHNMPDIYYIIPDEYAGFKSSKKYLNFDNMDFYNFLKKNNFYIVENGSSNYPSTFMSIPSSLNMNYLSEGDNLEKMFFYRVFGNKVARFLKEHSYKFVMIENTFQTEITRDSSLVKNTDININCSKYSLFENFYNRKTILRFLLKDYGLKLIRKEHLCAFNSLENTSKNIIKNPKFVFAHIVMPHSPFLFDQNGNPVFSIGSNTSTQDRKTQYLNQLKYANKLIKNTVEKILYNTKGNCIIIIQSDHGARFLYNKKVKNDKNVLFDNINAIYLPDKAKQKIFYSTLTPVNTFRLIFNEYFNANFEKLKDLKIEKKVN